MLRFTGTASMYHREQGSMFPGKPEPTNLSIIARNSDVADARALGVLHSTSDPLYWVITWTDITEEF